MFGSSMWSPPPHSCAPASALDAHLTSADPGPVVLGLLRLWRRGYLRALGLFLAELISTGDTPTTGLMLSRPLGDLPRRYPRRHQGPPAAAARAPDVRDPRRPSLRDPQLASMARPTESPAVVNHVAAQVTLTTLLHRLGAPRAGCWNHRLIVTHDSPPSQRTVTGSFTSASVKRSGSSSTGTLDAWACPSSSSQMTHGRQF